MAEKITSALVAQHIEKQVSLPNGSSATDSEKKLEILRDVNLTVENGESVAIVGASGSGKSTLLGILAGLDLPSSGEMYFYGRPFHQLDEEQRAAVRRNEVGFIFQQFLLVPSLTALENVMLPAELSDDPALRSQAEEAAKAWLEKVGLGHRLSHFPNQLSGGEQQRVAIARAFITKPKLLFADEPSANLDADNGKRIEDLLFELNQSVGTTLILVTHNPVLAQRCGRMMMLENGCLMESQSASKGEANDMAAMELNVAEAIANAF